MALIQIKRGYIKDASMFLRYIRDLSIPYMEKKNEKNLDCEHPNN